MLSVAEAGLRTNADAWAALREVARKWVTSSRLGVYRKPTEAPRRLQEEQRYLVSVLRLFKGRTVAPQGWNRGRPKFLRSYVCYTPVDLLGTPEAPGANERIAEALEYAARIGVSPADEAEGLDLVDIASFEMARGVCATAAAMVPPLKEDATEHAVGTFEDYMSLLEAAAEEPAAAAQTSEGDGRTLTAKVAEILADDSQANAAAIIERLGIPKTESNLGTIRKIVSRLHRS